MVIAHGDRACPEGGDDLVITGRNNNFQLTNNSLCSFRQSLDIFCKKRNHHWDRGRQQMRPGIICARSKPSSSEREEENEGAGGVISLLDGNGPRTEMEV